MAVYIIFLILCFLNGSIIYYTGVTDQKNRIYLYISIFWAVVIATFRKCSVGWDTERYVLGFQILNGDKSDNYKYTAEHWEIFWKYMNILIGKLGGNEQILFFVVSLFIMSGVGIFIYSNIDKNKTVFMPFIMFITLFNLWSSSMNLMRQYCALAIVINIFSILNNKVTKKRVVLCIMMIVCSMGFHITGILGIFILLVCVLPRITKKMIYVQLFVVFSISWGYSLVLKFIPVLVPKYAYYVKNFFYSTRSIYNYYVIIIIIKLVCTFLVLSLVKVNRDENINLYKINMICNIGIVFQLLAWTTNLAERLGYYFDIYIVLLISKLIWQIKLKERYLAMLLVIILAIAFYLFSLNAGAKGIVPYKFYWQK